MRTAIATGVGLSLLAVAGAAAMAAGQEGEETMAVADAAHVRVTNMPEGEGTPFAPLDEAMIEGSIPEGGSLQLRDGAGRTYVDVPAHGYFAVALPVGGALGRQKTVLVDGEGTVLAEAAFDVDARTRIECNAGGYAEVWNRLQAYLERRHWRRNLGGRRVTVYVPWLRDNTYVMKAFKYWEPDIGSFEEHFLDIQTPSGMLYDYIRRDDATLRERVEVFEPRYSRMEDGYGYNRLPITADVEYLAVEAIYTSWQARADAEWMARQLPRLDKAMNYMMTDPLRWSDEYGLVKRAYTIDTWDFKLYGTEERDWKDGNEVQEYVFNIHPETPKCIMHGDNSGMYQACRQMAIMHRAVGNDEQADEYDRKADAFRDRLNECAWNGRYYDQWVPIDPLEVDQGGIDGRKSLSLSNPYDINRGITNHEQAASIIREYIRLREELKDTHFAEWVSVYPCWPKGFHSVGPGEYVNGGIILIVAGELSKAAFHNGFEQYGADIIQRVYGLMEDYRPDASDGRRERGSPVPCSYEPSGKVSYGIPDGWAHAAVMSAIMEGLCGIRDEATAFRRARIEPRWPAAGVTQARVTAHYGASDGYVAYAFRDDQDAGRIGLTITGSAERLDLHVLLPAGATPQEVTVNGEAFAFTSSTVEQSTYADFSAQPVGPIAVDITYALP